jgi:3-dehydroquinate dehydratase/shikimate dehydrogenase
VNTDVSGFLDPLAAELGLDTQVDSRSPRIDLSRYRATVIGAGGAARSVVYALRLSGCRVLVLNRTAARAQALAEEFGCQWGPLENSGYRALEEFNDILVQTTSVGMSPHEGTDPVELYSFRGHEIAYDLVYAPPLTRFLERAQAAGCRIIYGEDMLLRQALHQFYLFTGQTYPEQVRMMLQEKARQPRRGGGTFL